MSLRLDMRHCAGSTLSTTRFLELPIHSLGDSIIYQCLQFFTSDVNPGIVWVLPRMTVGLLRFGHCSFKLQ
ncbi:hypothetical protein HanRHA438_Chr09g0410211 [Helianthus annuus]|nr:hypothetical protein HanRHA438_Chr09g0410211 [Helianthus annuus]